MRVLVPLIVVTAIGVLVTPAISIAFFLFDANESNSLVAGVTKVAQNLIEPFEGIFTLDEPQLSDAVSRVIAAVVYLVIAGALSIMLKRAH